MSNKYAVPGPASNRRSQQVFVTVRAMQLTVRTPPDFNFHRTVLSHGWCELLPFELDRAKWKLTRVLARDRSIDAGNGRCVVA
ncbi:MAG: hypothetical protein DMF73_05815 [Acidobacteria bacterium]|nr:MAG: hypothetical protein DMF73_05815 [Acidobacteriota bacterium]